MPSRRAAAKAEAAETIDIEARLAPFFPWDDVEVIDLDEEPGDPVG